MLEIPGRMMCAHSFLRNELLKQSAQGSYRKPMSGELQEKDTPWLMHRERTKLADVANLGNAVRWKPEFLECVVEHGIV
jgi:hypothetical protein